MPPLRRVRSITNSFAHCTKQENKMHGYGSYTDAEGVVFKGQFFNGKYNIGRAFVSLR